MARPKKEKLDYFPFDVDFFSDKKIKRLRAKFGADGVLVYIYSLCEMYSNSYYAEYDDDFIDDVSDYFHFSEEKTRQIMAYLLGRSLLVSILLGSVKVITAPAVQRRYQEAKKSSKRDIVVDKRIWLLKKDETGPFIKVYPDDSFSGKNEGYSEKNSCKSEKNDTKESKVKKSKVKESMCVPDIPEIPCKNGSFVIDEEYYNELTHTFRYTDVKESLSSLRNYMLSNPEKQRYMSAAKGCIQWWISGDEESGKHRRKEKPSYDLSLYDAHNTILEEDV